MTVDETRIDTVMDRLSGTRDVMTVQRVFGEAYHADGVTVIPVAAVRGAAGGGGGEGPNGNGATQGNGAGMGFAAMAKPLGVYEIRDGSVTWRPAIDVMRITMGGQILAAIALFTLGRILTRNR